MSNFTLIKKNPTQGEITSSLTGSTGDGAGLHFNGAGNISFTPVDLGSKFSHEFVIKADEDLTTGSSSYIIDYEGGSGRFVIGAEPTQASGNLAIYDDAGWKSFGVNPLTDLKVHHIVVTVDGTAAVLYDNGNQVGTATINANHGIDNATAAAIGSNFFTATSNNFEGTIYRARVYNRTLSADDVRTAFERSDVPFDDQWGQQQIISNANDRTFGGAVVNWTAQSGATIAVSSGELEIQFGTGASNFANLDNTGMELGRQYRVTLDIRSKAGDGDIPNVDIGHRPTDNRGGSNYFTVTATEAGATVTGVITVTNATSSGRDFMVMMYSQNNKTVYIDNVQIDRIGCVSDYDLAYANENQSRMVVDRSTNNVDGEMSSSGVKQTQVIKQLNSTAMRVGGTSATPATPADGAIIADKVGAGIAPAAPLHAKTPASTGTSPLEVARLEVKDEGLNMNAGMGPKLTFYTPHTDASFEGASIAAKKEDAGDYNEATSLVFSTCPDAGTNTERLTIASDGNIEQHTDANGIVKFVVKNESTGTSARAMVNVISDHGNLDLSMNGTNYTGVAGWADSGVVSTGSVVGGGLKLNAVAGGLALQTNQTTRVSIANSTGLATFANDVAYDDNARVYHGNLPSTGPSHSGHDKYNFNFTFSGTYGVALITLDIAAGIGEVAAGRYTLAVSCTANSGVTTQLMGSVTDVFKDNLSALTFADSGGSNRTFTLSVERTVTAENWGTNTGSYKAEVTNNHRTLTLNSVTAST